MANPNPDSLAKALDHYNTINLDQEEENFAFINLAEIALTTALIAINRQPPTEAQSKDLTQARFLIRLCLEPNNTLKSNAKLKNVVDALAATIKVLRDLNANEDVATLQPALEAFSEEDKEEKRDISESISEE